MISKKFSLLALLFISLTPSFISLSVSDAAQAEAYQGKDAEWKYLEAKFIVEPSKKLHSQVQQIRTIGLLATAIGILSTQIQAVQEFTFDAKKLALNNLVTISAIGLPLLAVETCTNYLDARIKHDTLVKFIKNWEFHKKYVPTSLIPAFDELAAAFNASTRKSFEADEVTQIFEVIQHLLEHTFASRYKPQEEKKESLFATFKTITDISKNLAPEAPKNK